MNNLSRRALTLLELVVVLVVLAALAAMIVPLVSGPTEDVRKQATLTTLSELQQVIMNRYKLDMNGVLPFEDDGNSFDELVWQGLPGPTVDNTDGRAWLQLKYLFDAPSSSATYTYVTGRGWRGPYLLSGRGNYPGIDLQEDAPDRGFTTRYGVPKADPFIGDPTVLDGWGNPIVIDFVTDKNGNSNMLAIVSAGTDGRLDLDLRNDLDLGILLQ